MTARTTTVRQRFTPALLKAVLRPDDEAAQQAAKHEDWLRFLMKLDVLALDCGITRPDVAQDLTESDWRHIALVLAHRHVPGFMPPLLIPKGGKRRGRPSKDYDAVLLAQMDALIAKGHSIRSAAKRLETKLRRPAAIESHYRRMKRTLANAHAAGPMILADDHRRDLAGAASGSG